MPGSATMTNSLTNVPEVALATAEPIEYTVDYIVDERFNKKKKMTEYLVKWTNFSHAENSWETAEGLLELDRLLEEWNRSKSDIFTVEKILDERTVDVDGRQVVQYLAKFVGYDDSENLWLTEENIYDHKLIESWKKKKKAQMAKRRRQRRNDLLKRRNKVTAASAGKATPSTEALNMPAIENSNEDGNNLRNKPRKRKLQHVQSSAVKSPSLLRTPRNCRSIYRKVSSDHSLNSNDECLSSQSDNVTSNQADQNGAPLPSNVESTSTEQSSSSPVLPENFQIDSTLSTSIEMSPKAQSERLLLKRFKGGVWVSTTSNDGIETNQARDSTAEQSPTEHLQTVPNHSPDSKQSEIAAYQSKVQRQFENCPQVIADFCEIVQLAQSADVINILNAFQKVSQLFKDNPELIVGFQVFLPTGFVIELPPSNEAAILLSSSVLNCLNSDDSIKQPICMADVFDDQQPNPTPELTSLLRNQASTSTAQENELAKSHLQSLDLAKMRQQKGFTVGRLSLSPPSVDQDNAALIYLEKSSIKQSQTSKQKSKRTQDFEPSLHPSTSKQARLTVNSNNIAKDDIQVNADKLRFISENASSPAVEQASLVENANLQNPGTGEFYIDLEEEDCNCVDCQTERYLNEEPVNNKHRANNEPIVINLDEFVNNDVEIKKKGFSDFSPHEVNLHSDDVVMSLNRPMPANAQRKLSSMSLLSNGFAARSSPALPDAVQMTATPSISVPIRSSSPQVEQPMLACKFHCGKTFPLNKKAKLIRHERIHGNGTLFRCTWSGCKYTAKVADYVRTHGRRMHFEQMEAGIQGYRNPNDFIEIVPNSQ